MATYWKRWLGLAIFAVVLVAAFLRLGEWQLNRLEERREQNATVVAQQEAPVAAFDDVFGDPVTEAEQFRRVEVRGTFDANAQLQVRFRSNDGASGYEVVAPLQAADGSWVLVNRGFVPRAANGSIPAPEELPDPPTGPVTVRGYVMASEPGPDSARTPASGSVRVVNTEAIAAWSSLPLVDGYLNATEMDPPQDGVFVPVALPELDEGPHMSYAVQWFSFATIGVVGTFILIGKDTREILGKRRRKATLDTSGE